MDDPSQVPDNVRDLVNQMQKELNDAAHTRGETVDDAEARVNAVIAQFQDLAQRLSNKRETTNDPTTPGATPVADTPTPTATMPQGTPTGTPAETTPAVTVAP